jgi:hypothetical protein
MVRSQTARAAAKNGSNDRQHLCRSKRRPHNLVLYFSVTVTVTQRRERSVRSVIARSTWLWTHLVPGPALRR